MAAANAAIRSVPSGKTEQRMEQGAMLKDRFGRTINYMRVSITDRCPLRCRYCMPEGGPHDPGPGLSCGEIVRVCAAAAQLGIDRFRITGGEPLIRKDCAQIIAQLNSTPGVREVLLTTNGILLSENLESLLRAGLDGVNISLDTLDRGEYLALTGADALDKVLASIDRCAGRLKVKINCVVSERTGADTVTALAGLAREMPVDVRYIEMMPIGAGKAFKTVPNSEILRMLEEKYGPMAKEGELHGNGPAVYRKPAGFSGSIGFVSAVHEKFCDRCNRLRLTAAGDLKPCLCYADRIPLLEILRGEEAGMDERLREKIREAVEQKPRAHCFEDPGAVTEELRMAQIGG